MSHAGTSPGTALPPGQWECVPAAATAVFQSLCGISVQADPAEPSVDFHDAIFGVITLVGDVEWALFLGLRRDAAETMARAFAGFEIAFDSGDMCDAVGEMTNILAGGVKQELDNRGIRSEISVPTILRDQEATALFQHNRPMEVAFFKTPQGQHLLTGVVAAGG